MRAVAAVIMVLGVLLMSAPLVLPRLGITLTTASAEPSPPAGGGIDIGRLSGFGTAMSEGAATVGALLGTGASDAAAPPSAMPATGAEVAAQFDAVCAALAGSGQMSAADCDAAALMAPGAGPGAAGLDPAAAMAAAAAAMGTAGAAAIGTGSAAGILEIDRAAPGRPAGAKFVKVQK